MKFEIKFANEIKLNQREFLLRKIWCSEFHEPQVVNINLTTNPLNININIITTNPLNIINTQNDIDGKP